MKKCKLHIIGQYWHSSSELNNFVIGEDIDGEGTISGYYNYCPTCGTKITKTIINYQLNYSKIK